MNGPLFCLSLIGFGIAWALFYTGDNRAKAENKHWWERAAAAVSAIATFGILLSLDGWFGQVWWWAGEGIGLFILLVVTAAAGVFGLAAITRGFAHHRHSTLALGVILGAAVSLVYGDLVAIKANVGKALTSAMHGVTTAPGKVRSAATHAHTTAPGHPAVHSGDGLELLGLILLLAAFAVAAVIVIRRHRNGEVRNITTGRGAKALGSGSGRRGGGLGLPADTAYADR